MGHMTQSTPAPTDPAMPEADVSRYPSLRSAAWLYLSVLLFTTIIIVGLPQNIDVRLLRLLAALILAGGGTMLALFLTNTGLGAIFGRRPRPGALILSLLTGAALWLPVSWLLIVVDGLLDVSLGFLPAPRALQSGVSTIALIVQFGLVVPLCQGLLFWAFIQRAAEGVGSMTGATLTAVLFALYGLVSADFGMTIIPAYLLIGLAAAFAGYFTGSAWAGIGVLVGYHLTRALFENTQGQVALFNTLGAETPEQLIGARWLFALALSLFAAFAMLQALRALHPREANAPRSAPRRLWWIPVVVGLALCLWISYGEINTRLLRQRGLNPQPSSNATMPPQGR